MLLITSLLVLSVAALALWQRHYLIFNLLGKGESSPFLESSAEDSSTPWYDDYFIVNTIDRHTFAIGEPLYSEQNFSYLIVGNERAVLFDAGPGHRDIRAVAESLTELPITFVPSHLHFDHVGNSVTFDRVAVVDLPSLRERAPNNELTLVWYEHLGAREGIEAPTLFIDEWLPIGGSIDLGSRVLRVLYTPGHTDDSISLYDESTGAVFVGDFIYPGPLYAFLPNSSLQDYALGADNLLSQISSNDSIYTAHRDSPPGIPLLATSDIEDLQRTLRAIKGGTISGSGVYPYVYKVNERIELMTEPPFLHDWDRE